MPDDTDSKKPTPADEQDEDIDFFTMATKADPQKEIGLVSAPPDVLQRIPSKYTYTTRDKTVIRDLVKIDNKQQFLTALFIEGETDTDKTAREAIAAYVGEILDRLAGQAIRQEKIDYQYTSEIIAEAIAKARTAGIDSPYIDALEEMQRPAQTDTTPSLFPDLPPNTAETGTSSADIVTVQQAQLLAADAKARYPAPPYVRPDYIKIPTANLARNFYNADTKNHTPSLDGTNFAYPVDQRPHQHFVFMRLLDAISEQYPIEPIDKNILISLGNLYAERKAAGRVGIHGGAILSTEDIIRLYRGYDATANIYEDEINAVKERILKMLNMRVSFDFTQHFVYNKVGDEVQLSIPDERRVHVTGANGETRIIRFSYSGNMIDARIAEIEYSNGKIITAYELLTPPILYEYSEKIKQVQRIETKLLDLRKKANSSKDADVIKIYLLEQINAMKHGRSNRILLKTLFSELRIEINNRKLKKAKAEVVKKILKHFSETKQSNGKTLIKGFSEVIGYHRALEGYDIYFENEPNK